MKMKIKEIAEKIDKAALTKAVGLMIISWAALPIVYWLIVKNKGVEKEKNGK